MIESVVIITDQSPMGKNSALEAIRIGSGFVALGEYVNCQIVFMGDAVYLLNKNAKPEAIGMDPLDETMEIADLSDLELYVVDQALEDAGMSAEDLIEYENLKIITIDEVVDLIENADTSFRF
ncbi:MAG: DsrE family protein [Candidatus Lokiarchaeota archaeon]|nr:DsrE family protein [Candidatus Lokiarchaeota archaeon]